MTLYRQCELRQGSQVTMGWIEDRGARLQARVEMPDLGGFWRVAKVYNTYLTAAELREKQKRDRNCLPSVIGGGGGVRI